MHYRYSSIKNLLLALCVSATAFSAQAQWVSIPDTNFGKWLNTNGYNMCLQGNSSVGWQMDTTCNKVLSEDSVDCSNREIRSIEGIQYFDKLRILRCSYNKLNSLLSIPTTLIYLDCSDNKLTSLSTLPDSLTYLDCSINELTSLPALPNSLTYLDCLSNYLPVIILPNSLTYLKCADNQLTSLPPLPNALMTLICFSNNLTSLPPLPNSLTQLWCDGNQLTSLPLLPDSLIDLRCGTNQLTSLPVLPDSLDFLICSNNPSLSCLPKLGIVKSLNFGATNIACLPNFPEQNIASTPPLNTVSICEILNTNGCDIYYNISGNVYKDSIQNCRKDASELEGNAKMLLYRNGALEQQVTAKTYGTYTFDAELDTFEIRIDTTGMPYTVACPSTFFHTSILTLQDSMDTDKDFGLRCKPGFDVGVLSAVGDSGRLRPTFIAGIHVKAGDLSKFYGLSCAAGVSGTVSITYSGPVSFAGVMSGALTPTVSGTTLTYTIADFGAIDMQNAFGLRFLVDTFAQIGQRLCLDVVVTPTAGDNNVSNNTATYCFPAVNSHDPNMKEVSPVNSIAPTEDWLTYTIHFQNMGNAPAIHIYVMDTLDNNLDESSIQILGSSHRMLTEIKGNIARFNFPNINLVDSATNEPESKGWLQYKIKKNTGLALGTQIKNTASIYFDFNAPVVTNTVTNIVEEPSAVSFPSSEGLGVDLYPNPTNNDVFITYSSNTSADVTLFNINGAACLKQQLTASNQSISLSGLPAGVYFVSVATGGSVVRKKVVKW